MSSYPTTREEWIAEATTCYLDGVRALEKARDLDRFQQAMAHLQAGLLAAALAGLVPGEPGPAGESEVGSGEASPVGWKPAVPRVLPMTRPQAPVSVNVGSTRVVVEQA